MNQTSLSNQFSVSDARVAWPRSRPYGQYSEPKHQHHLRIIIRGFEFFQDFFDKIVIILFLCPRNAKENKPMHETDTSDKYFPKFIVCDDILNARGTNSSNNESKLVQNKFRDKDFIECTLLKNAVVLL